MKRFQDRGEDYTSFFDKVLIHCPKCTKPVDLINAKIACTNCGFNKDFKSEESDSSNYSLMNYGQEIEYFLEIECCGHELFARNIEHLDFLESYVKSTLRERIPNVNRSLASRLPQWIKDSKNRDAVIKCINKLREKLKKNNYISNNN